MAKIKAVLDQETWVEIDVPDEFQSIINLLFSTDGLTSESLNGSEDDNSTSYHDVGTNNNVQSMADTGQSNAEQNNSIEASISSAALDRSKPLAESTERNRAHSKISSAQSNNTDAKDNKKSVSQALFYKGVGYHMVNWLVIRNQLFYFCIICTFCSLCSLCFPCQCSLSFPLSLLVSHA